MMFKSMLLYNDIQPAKGFYRNHDLFPGHAALSMKSLATLGHLGYIELMLLFAWWDLDSGQMFCGR